MNKLIYRLLYLATLLLLSSAAVVWAQDATPEAATEVALPASTDLSYSTPVQGNISDSAFTQTWNLQTASADRIRVRVERTDGNLIPDVSILDANAQVLSSSYGSDQTGAVAEIGEYNLPAAGRYQVVVGRRNGETGVTTGSYTLTVIPLATAADNPNNAAVVGAVEFDAPVEGEITATHWYQRFTLQAQATDYLQIVAERTSGTLYPQVEVLDMNGASLTTGYTDYTGDIARTNPFSLASPGEYVIAVTRYNGFNGETVGGFRLTVKLLGSGMGSPLLAGITGKAEYDTPLAGEITNARWYQDWELTTLAGDTLSVKVERTGGNLQPEVLLLGGGGQELRRGYTDETGAVAEISRFTLQVPGKYTIRVQRASDLDGATAGAYSLRVTLDGSGVGSPNLATPAGEVFLGTPTAGEITNMRWMHIWTYNSTDGAPIDVVVTRTSGTLIPLIEIRDVNGQHLTNAYYNEAWDSAELRSYRFPAAGQYQIVVYRDSDQDGFTTGAYSLLVTAPPAAQ